MLLLPIPSNQANDDTSQVHDVHGQDAAPSRVQRLGKDGRPIMTHAGHELVHTPEQAHYCIYNPELITYPVDVTLFLQHPLGGGLQTPEDNRKRKK
jgi:hypothetical protein